MTKREVVETIINNNGCKECEYVYCDNCPFYEEGCSGSGNEESLKVAEQWLADHVEDSDWPEEHNIVHGSPRTGKYSDWKELKIDNLPSDILVGGYELKCLIVEKSEDDWRCGKDIDPIEALRDIKAGYKYRYRRKPIPKQLSHEEIMVLWFKIDECIWEKVSAYHNNAQYCYQIENEWYSQGMITKLESATIPPETGFMMMKET